MPAFSDKILVAGAAIPGRGADMDKRGRAPRERGLRQAVLAGDERAWRQWYDESFAAVDAYVAWRCGGLRDLADEVVQETWLVAVRRIRDFDPDAGSFAGWLCGIAANVVRARLRQRAHARQRVRSLGGADDLSGTVTLSDVEREEEAERVACALDELPERYERALRAKYLEARSVAEIAAEWQETTKAVESLLTRARQAFREAYNRLD
jgi:RNA polymerase sigma-70 factor (ECF subfamily)